MRYNTPNNTVSKKMHFAEQPQPIPKSIASHAEDEPVQKEKFSSKRIETYHLILKHYPWLRTADEDVKAAYFALTGLPGLENWKPKKHTLITRDVVTVGLAYAMIEAGRGQGRLIEISELTKYVVGRLLSAQESERIEMRPSIVAEIVSAAILTCNDVRAQSVVQVPRSNQPGVKTPDLTAVSSEGFIINAETTSGLTKEAGQRVDLVKKKLFEIMVHNSLRKDVSDSHQIVAMCAVDLSDREVDRMISGVESRLIARANTKNWSKNGVMGIGRKGKWTIHLIETAQAEQITLQMPDWWFNQFKSTGENDSELSQFLEKVKVGGMPIGPTTVQIHCVYPYQPEIRPVEHKMLRTQQLDSNANFIIFYDLTQLMMDVKTLRAILIQQFSTWNSRLARKKNSQVADVDNSGVTGIIGFEVFTTRDLTSAHIIASYIDNSDSPNRQERPFALKRLAAANKQVEGKNGLISLSYGVSNHFGEVL